MNNPDGVSTREEMEGCSSHACMVAKPEGMGTNSTKCYCPEWKIRRLIFALTARLEESEGQRDRLAQLVEDAYEEGYMTSTNGFHEHFGISETKTELMQILAEIKDE